jgi:hypothetical protein
MAQFTGLESFRTHSRDRRYQVHKCSQVRTDGTCDIHKDKYIASRSIYLDVHLHRVKHTRSHGCIQLDVADAELVGFACFIVDGSSVEIDNKR